MSSSRRLTLLALVLLVSPACAQERTPPPLTSATRLDETWQAIALQGQRIGYGHVVTTRQQRGDSTIVATDFQMHTALKRFNGKVTMIVRQHTEEDESGNLLSFHSELDNPPAARIEMTGKVENGSLQLQTSASGQTTSTTLPVPPDLKSPTSFDRLLEEAPLAAGEQRTFKTFDPQVGALLTIRATGRGPAEFSLPGGQPQRGTRVVAEYLDGIPGLATESYCDAQGHVVLTTLPLAGMTTWNVTRDEALADLPGDVDVGLMTLIQVPRIPQAERLRQATYRLHRASGLDAASIPSGPTQMVQQVDPQTVEVRVVSIAPQAESPPTGRTPAPTEADLAATTLARADDPEIVRFAGTVAKAGASPLEIATGAERGVHQWLNRKNMSTALGTASETVRSRSGDCTEHAVLLTAVLRARRIPARVVIGLVYWEQFTAFVGHAWTEAWIDGKWVALDATQGLGQVGADRIKLADSSLADGDAGLMAAVINAWGLLSSATLEISQLEFAPMR